MTAVASQVALRAETPSATSFSPEFPVFVDEIRRNGSIPGVSIGVVRLDEDKNPSVRLGSWGRKTEDGDGHDMTVDTLFGIASCSKAFLATSLGILMDDYAHGRNATPLPPTTQNFDFDTKVVDILPKELGWGLHDLYGDAWSTYKASIKDILGHVSGMPGSDYTYTRSDKAEDLVRRMKGLRTAYELREKWRTTTRYMYALGSVIVSTYAGMPYPRFVTERIFEPLKMFSTTFRVSAARSSGKLTEGWTKDGRRIPFWFDDDTIDITAGGGGIISSAEDMVKWLAVWLNKGVDPVSGIEIFPRTVYDAVTTAHWIVSGTSSMYGAGPLGYGMGWRRTSIGSVDVVVHTGGIPGFSILTAFSPSHNLGVAILSNADEKAPYNLAILKKVFNDVLGEQLAITSVPAVVRSAEHPQETSPPSLEIGAYVGTYSSFGYSSITLCSPDYLFPSPHFDQVLADFASLDSPEPVNANTTLYSTYPSIFATHVQLRHLSGDTFNITFTALFPHGYGRDTSAFETYETGSAEGWVEFVVRDGRVQGFSLVLDEDAVMARMRRCPSGQLRDAADAWFEKA